MWNTFPDSPVPAADILNRAVNEVRRHGRLWTAPPLQSFYSPSIGWLLWMAPTTVGSSGTMPTGGSFTARIGAGNGNAYAWTEQMRQGNSYVDMPNGASSDLDGSPAYELNGQANLKAGTVVNLVGAMKLDGMGIWVFHHPRHEHTMHLAVDRGRSNDGVGRAFDFGIRRPGYYFNQEPVTANLPNLCSFCDTDNAVTLPAPFLNKQGSQGIDGIYQLTAVGVGGKFSLTGALPDGTFFQSSDINDGDGAAAIMQAIRDHAYNGTVLTIPSVLPIQDIDGNLLLSTTSGPLGTLPIILTSHENSYWKLLLNSLTVSPPASGAFDTSAAFEVLQQATVEFVLDGFYPTRLMLSIDGGIGDFEMHLGVEQSPPFPGPSYANFDYTGAYDVLGNPTIDNAWQIDPEKLQLAGSTVLGGNTYQTDLRLPTQVAVPDSTTPVMATRVRCWPFEVQWLGFMMEQVIPSLAVGPIPTGTFVGPFNATATGIYF